jgi:N-formylglutamate amidohydrolase
VTFDWDPNPTFLNIPAVRPNADAADIAKAQARLDSLYASYADSLDEEYPMWHFEILTDCHPDPELAELAQQRRHKEGKP